MTGFAQRIHIFLVIVCLWCSVNSSFDSCMKEDSCSCQINDREEINLKRIGNSDETASFSVVHNSQQNQHGAEGSKQRLGEDNVTKFYYNPCYPFNIGPSDSRCRGVAACSYNHKTYQDIGVQSRSKFRYDKTKQEFYIEYYSADNASSSRVHLHCDVLNELIVDISVNSVTYFTLKSPCSCINGCKDKKDIVTVSTGTILCIVFVLVVITYLIVGMLYNKAAHSASGSDLIPHRTFWTTLPGLVKDGYMFFISPCLGQRAEYQTYEQLG